MYLISLLGLATPEVSIKKTSWLSVNDSYSKRNLQATVSRRGSSFNSLIAAVFWLHLFLLRRLANKKYGN
jgi:hypothetical protein